MLQTVDLGATVAGADGEPVHHLPDGEVVRRLPDGEVVHRLPDGEAVPTVVGVVVPAKKLLQTVALRALPDGHSAHVPVRLSLVRLMNLRKRKQVPQP